MKMLHVVLASSLLAAASGAQELTHVRIADSRAASLAAEFESTGLDVVEGSVRASSLELILSPASLEYVQGLGLEVITLAESRPFNEIQAERLAADDEDAVPAGYSPLLDLEAQMAQIEANFPALAKRVNFTQTYGLPQTFEGRDIYGLRISDNVNVEEDEPSVLLVSAHHCRELITPVVAMEAADRLTQGYGVVPGIQALVDANEIYIVPVWNVDGYEYVFSTANLWRKNRRDNLDGTFGVDLNRNYRAGWSAPCAGSTNTASSSYKGTAPASEAETIVMEALTADQRFAKVLDFHSSGRETLWGYACVTHSWDAFFLSMAQMLSTQAGYGIAERRPSAEGEHYEWQINNGAVSHLIETGTTFQPSFASAQAEAAQVWGAIQYLLGVPALFSGHVTDSCSGAALDADITFIGATSPFMGGWSAGGPFGRYDIQPPPGSYTVEFSAPGYQPQAVNVSIAFDAPLALEIALVPNSTVAASYCTAGTTTNGCAATLSGSGTASLSAASGFDVSAASVEGSKDGLFFFSANGRQANSWGNGTSLQCVIPPVQRTPLLTGSGTLGACDGALGLDFNAWMFANPGKAPSAGSTVGMQLWFRDPGNTSNQTTSLSDALEFGICP